MNLQDLADTEKDLNVRYRRVLSDLDTASVQAANAAIAGGESWNRATAAVAKLRAESDSISAAIAGIRQQRIATIKSTNAAKVVEMRREADHKRQGIITLQEQTAPLLAQISTLQGLEYDHAILVIRGSNSQKLADEAEALERSARSLENSPPRFDRGRAEGETLDALMTAIYSKPELIAPTEAAITEWNERVCEQLRGDRFTGSRVTRLRFAWLDGRIDGENSYVEVQHAGQPYPTSVREAAVMA